VLIRLPVCAEIGTIKDELMSDFNKKMCGLSQKHTVPYWSFMDKLSGYTYTDGNHLYKESGRKISTEIAATIRENRPTMCGD